MQWFLPHDYLLALFIGVATCCRAAIAVIERASTRVRVSLAPGGCPEQHVSGLLAAEPLEFRACISSVSGLYCPAGGLLWQGDLGFVWSKAGTLPPLLCLGPVLQRSNFLPHSLPGPGIFETPDTEPLLAAVKLLTRQPATMGESVWKPLLPVLGARDALWKAPDTHWRLACVGKA